MCQLEMNRKMEYNYHILKQKLGNVIYSLKTHEKAIERKKRYISWMKWANIILVSSILVSIILQLIFKNDFYSYIGIGLTVVEFSLVLIGLNFNYMNEVHEHEKTISDLWKIREQIYNLLVDIKGKSIDINDVIKRRDEIDKCLNLIYKYSLKTSNKDYKKASGVLKNGEKPKSDDEEYRNFLPENLWEYSND